jgi:hypothetical protein
MTLISECRRSLSGMGVLKESNEISASLLRHLSTILRRGKNVPGDTHGSAVSS